MADQAPTGPAAPVLDSVDPGPSRARLSARRTVFVPLAKAKRHPQYAAPSPNVRDDYTVLSISMLISVLGEIDRACEELRINRSQLLRDGARELIARLRKERGL